MAFCTTSLVEAHVAVAGAIGGEIANRLSSDPVEHYELFIGVPVLVAGIAYLVAASRGNERVEACRRLDEGAERGCDGCPAAVP